MRISPTPYKIASTVRSATPGRSITLSGTDRIANVAKVKGIADGAILTSVRIEPASFSRLSGPARAFQKIQWNQLRFHIAPRVSTSSAGGYVAGFVADAGDDLPLGEEGKIVLTAQLGTISCPIYKPSTFTCTVPRRTYYTNYSENPRLSSPGTFYVILDGAATQDGGLVVTCDWSVTLSVPGDAEDIELAPGLLFFADVHIDKDDPSYYLQGKGSDGKMSKDMTKFTNIREVLAKAPDTKYFQAVTPITVATSTGTDTKVATYAVRFLTVAVQTGGTVYLTGSEEIGQAAKTRLDAAVLIASRDDIWKPYSPPNTQLGFWRPMAPTARSPSGARLFSRVKLRRLPPSLQHSLSLQTNLLTTSESPSTTSPDCWTVV